MSSIIINAENASEEAALLSNGTNGDDGNEKPKSWRSTSVVSWTLLRRGLLVLAAVSMMAYVIFQPVYRPFNHNISVAFIGNSITYFNDLPRFLETIADGHLEQNSCLHGQLSLTSILEQGNGMFHEFNTSNALNSDGVYDFGACTVKQLLFGHDDELEENVRNRSVVLNYTVGEIFYKDWNQDNPCIQDPSYLEYLDTHTFQRRRRPPHWNFIVLNDNTRNPSKATTRDEGLRILQEVYVPWFLETGATPVFFDTHAYWLETQNMTSLVDIPTFTSMTYQGYKDYAAFVTKLLPPSQAPRLAPVGVAFLTVWEENRHLWHKLFHKYDHLHPSPSGTFLTGAIIHVTLFGEMPRKEAMLPPDQDMSVLWARARMMQQAGDPSNPLPTFEDAVYLYDVADRVARRGYIPRALILYEHDESAPDIFWEK